jgi:membrane dipeptidase
MRLRLALCVLLVFSAPVLVLVQQEATGDAFAARARQLHADAIVLDTHIDTTGRLLDPGWSFLDRHQPPVGGSRGPGGRSEGNAVDLPRMREGGLDGAFFSIFIPGNVTGPEAVKRSLELIDAVRSLAARHPDRMALATTAAEVRAAHQAGKTIALMGMEGGHMIDDSLAVLRSYAALGVRYLTLTHSVHTNWADSSSQEPTHGGLTTFGRDVVHELNRLGVMVDVSHVADETFWDVLEASRAPLLASHSSCRAISGHPRNMTDEMIKAMAAKGGVIQINYLDAYLDHATYLAQEERRKALVPLRAELEQKYPGTDQAGKRMQELRAAMAAMPPLPRPSWEKIVEHIDHAVKIAGDEHVGLGSDFDGATMPEGMEDVTQLPKITEALLRKGYTERQVRNILGENLLRLMARVQQVAN